MESTTAISKTLLLLKGKIMARRLQDKGSSADGALEDFVAELTDAAYPVALRHGVRRQWLDFELELWNVMTQTVKKWEQHSLLALSK